MYVNSYAGKSRMHFPAGIYLLKVNNRNSGASGVVLVSLLLTLNIFNTLFYVSIASFELVIAGWVWR